MAVERFVIGAVQFDLSNGGGGLVFFQPELRGYFTRTELASAKCDGSGRNDEDFFARFDEF